MYIFFCHISLEKQIIQAITKAEDLRKGTWYASSSSLISSCPAFSLSGLLAQHFGHYKQSDIPGKVEVHEVFAFDKQVLDNLAHQTFSGYFYMDTFRPPAYWIVPKLRKYPALKFQFLLTFLTCSTRCSNSDRLFFTASSRFSPFVSGSCREFVIIFISQTQVQ